MLDRNLLIAIPGCGCDIVTCCARAVMFDAWDGGFSGKDNLICFVASILEGDKLAGFCLGEVKVPLGVVVGCIGPSRTAGKPEPELADGLLFFCFEFRSALAVSLIVLFELRTSPKVCNLLFLAFMLTTLVACVPGRGVMLVGTDLLDSPKRSTTLGTCVFPLDDVLLLAPVPKPDRFFGTLLV